MSDGSEREPAKAFAVTVEDAERWAKRFQRMAQHLEGKGAKADEDAIRMFYTASVLMQQLCLEIQHDQLLHEVGNPFGDKSGKA